MKKKKKKIKRKKKKKRPALKKSGETLKKADVLRAKCCTNVHIYIRYTVYNSPEMSANVSKIFLKFELFHSGGSIPLTAKLGVGKYAREQESIFFASLPWPQYEKNTPSTGSRVLHLKWYEILNQM